MAPASICLSICKHIISSIFFNNTSIKFLSLLIFDLNLSSKTINFLVKKHKIKIKYLPERYNLQDIFRKHLLHIPNFSWWEDKLLFLDAGWVYHFNAIPSEIANGKNTRPASYWMKRTYEELYG